MRIFENRIRKIISEEIRRALYENINGRDLKNAIAEKVGELQQGNPVQIQFGPDSESVFTARIANGCAVVEYDGRKTKYPCGDPSAPKLVERAVYGAFMDAYLNLG